MTDGNGQVAFLTIFPGWYSGRTAHIHFKVRTDPDSQQGTEFTSQLFFDETLTEQIYQRDPYSSKGSPDTPNSQDNIFAQSGGELTATLVADGDGFSGQFHVGVGAV